MHLRESPEPSETREHWPVSRRTLLRGTAAAGAFTVFGIPAFAGSAAASPVGVSPILYGTEKTTGAFYMLDPTAVSPTAVALMDDNGNPVALPAALTDGDTTNGEVELNANSPNGNALDTTTNRYYFTEFKDEATASSDLWFVDLTDGSFTKAGALEGRAASGTVDGGVYWYVKNVTDEVQQVSLKADGTIDTEQNAGRLFNGALDRSGTDQFGLFFGDIAFDNAGLMYFSCDTKRPVQRLQGTWDPTEYDASDYTAATTLWGVLGSDTNGNGIPDSDPNSDWETVIGDKVQISFAGDDFSFLYGHRTSDGQIFKITPNVAGDDASVTSLFNATDGFTDITGNKVLCSPLEVPLCAGQDIDVGTVSVVDLNGELTVKYDVTDDDNDPSNDWYIAEVHVAVVDDPDDFPTVGNGNPQVGHFDYVDDTIAAGTQMYTTPPFDFSDDGDGMVYIAAHAVVYQVDADGEWVVDETAWPCPGADGVNYLTNRTGRGRGGGGQWATYFAYTPCADR